MTEPQSSEFAGYIADVLISHIAGDADNSDFVLRTQSSEFAGYIADVLISHIAGDADNSDFVLRTDGDVIEYVSPEEGKAFLITVKEARLVEA